MELTDEQRKRIEVNRQKALLLRQEKSKARASAHPYQKYFYKFDNNFFVSRVLLPLMTKFSHAYARAFRLKILFALSQRWLIPSNHPNKFYGSIYLSLDRRQNQQIKLNKRFENLLNKKLVIFFHYLCNFTN